MRRFNIVEPRFDRDACKILAEDDDVKLIAAATALLILIKHGILFPKTLVNLKRSKARQRSPMIPTAGSEWAVWRTIYDVESCRRCASTTHCSAQACHVVANIRIRNMATIRRKPGARRILQSDPPGGAGCRWMPA